MVDHGVKRYQAEQAYSAVHTAEHEHVERQRRELLQKLTGAGLRKRTSSSELSKPARGPRHDRRRADRARNDRPGLGGR